MPLTGRAKNLGEEPQGSSKSSTVSGFREIVGFVGK